MGRTVYTPESIPIPLSRQEELAAGWRDLPSEWAPWHEVPPGEESIADRCDEIIAELPEDPSKKDQLIALYLVLNDGESMIAPRRTADVVDCSLQYARSFEYDIEQKRVTDGNGLDPQLREHIRSKDTNECVRCGSEDELAVHHITPFQDGGTDTVANLVTLCHSCHREAHGNTWGDVDYDSTDEFWDWVDAED